jgi:hypothetical protein
MLWSFALWRTEVGQFRGHRGGRLEQKRDFYVKWMRCHFMIKFENYMVDDEGGYYPGSVATHTTAFERSEPSRSVLFKRQMNLPSRNSSSMPSRESSSKV